LALYHVVRDPDVALGIEHEIARAGKHVLIVAGIVHFYGEGPGVRQGCELWLVEGRQLRQGIDPAGMIGRMARDVSERADGVLGHIAERLCSSLQKGRRAAVAHARG
jgi:hypothetical protein